MLLYSIIDLLGTLVIVNTFLLHPSQSTSTLTVDVDKGVVFEQIGFYSDKLEQHVFHIFVPLSDLCTDSENSDVCHHPRTENTPIMEIGTIESSIAAISTIYDKKTILNTITEDIRRVFYNFEVDKLVDKAKSMIYFIENTFYLPSIPNNVNPNNALVPSNNFSSELSQYSMKYRSSHMASLVRRQIIRKKFGFDFLTDDQTMELMLLITSNTSGLLNVDDRKEIREIFFDTIVGQSIFMMRSCSMSDKENVPSTSPCLLISTIARKLPSDSSSIYNVYRSIPLPISLEGHQYIYKNIPQIFGYNRMNKNVLLWNDGEMSSSCLVSNVIQCSVNPAVVELSALPCLFDLLNEKVSSISQCEVSMSDIYQTGVLNVHRNLWYFYSTDGPLICQSSSMFSDSMNITTIHPPTLVFLPCNEEIECSQITLPASACTARSLHLKTTNTLISNDKSFLSLPLNNIANRLLLIHKSTRTRSFKQLLEEIKKSRTLVNTIIEDFLGLVISSLSLLLVSILVIIFKRIRNGTIMKLEKLQTKFNQFERDVVADV